MRWEWQINSKSSKKRYQFFSTEDVQRKDYITADDDAMLLLRNAVGTDEAALAAAAAAWWVW